MNKDQSSGVEGGDACEAPFMDKTEARRVLAALSLSRQWADGLTAGELETVDAAIGLMRRHCAAFTMNAANGVNACEAPSWPNFTDSEADIARLFPIWQTKDEKGRDCPLVRLVDLVGVVQATYGERAERDRAVASWKKAAGRLTAHWKANGPAVEAQWCTHAAQLLSMGDELLTHGVGGLDDNTFPHQSPLPSLKEE